MKHKLQFKLMSMLLTTMVLLPAIVILWEGAIGGG